jgi:hypothetical protein
MSNNKQDHIVDTNKMVTAVEWLFNEYVDKGVITIQAIEQALEMEKEQILNAFDYGLADGFDDALHGDESIDSTQYYKETYLQ